MFGNGIREVERGDGSDRGRNGFVEQRVDARCADGRQHGVDVGGGGADVPAHELAWARTARREKRALGNRTQGPPRRRCWFPRCHRYLRVLTSSNGGFDPAFPIGGHRDLLAVSLSSVPDSDGPGA